MNILGIWGSHPDDYKKLPFSFASPHFHDAGSSLFIDGVHVCSLSEERLTKKKRETQYPKLTIDYALNKGNIKKEDIDVIMYSYNLANGNLTEPYYEDAITKIFPNAKMQKVFHHQAHAVSALWTSPFDRASIFTIDNGGGWLPWNGIENSTFCIGDKEEGITVLNHSIKAMTENAPGAFMLASFYAWVAKNKCEIEGHYLDVAGKLMGMSAYGDYTKVTYGHPFNVFDGNGFYFPQILDNPNFPTIMQMPDDKHHPHDIAAWAQHELEEALLEFFNKIKLKEKYLCLAGGVTYNVTANTRILEEGPFEDIWICPAASDLGIPLGAAIWGAFLYEKEILFPEGVAFLG